MRSGGYTERNGRFYARVRVGQKKRIESSMKGVTDPKTASSRSATIAEVADMLLTARRGVEIREYAKNIGAATDEKHVRAFVLAARHACAQAAIPNYATVTFEQFAERWTSGQLHLDHPDHVAKKQSAGDINILKNRINPVVGPLSLTSFAVEDADRVMRELPTPPTISRAYRRAVAQVIHRVLSLAVWPAKIIKANPLPKGWLPKIGKPKAKSFLYPKEEAALLAGSSDIRYRMFVGFLNREGPRKTEARLMTWDDFDLENGTVTLDKNKTDSPRSWSLDTGVVRALRIWKRARGGAGPFAGLNAAHLGEWLRTELPRVGVTRAQLFKQSEQRLHFRAHDTRSTFVTLSLAAGKSEAWIMNRTAHRSSSMIARYTVMASMANEIGLGPLLPLDEAIPELRGKVLKIAETNDMKRAGAQRGRATQAARRRRVGETRVKATGTNSAKDSRR